jgi:hypothetical protein
MSENVSAAASPTEAEEIVFRSKPRNMAVGVALILAGALAFTMGMTDVFFAEAMAWVAVLWGALFLFSDIIEMFKTYTVTEKALIIRSPGRFWTPRKEWEWGNIFRMDVIVKRPDAHIDDMELLVYYTAPGDSAIEREDRQYSPFLAQCIIERARLKPTEPTNPTNLEELPPGKGTYYWNKSGRMTQTG